MPSSGSDAEEVYEVEKILGVKEVNSVSMFLIKWKGYQKEDNTWEPIENLNCPDLLEQFLASLSP